MEQQKIKSSIPIERLAAQALALQFQESPQLGMMYTTYQKQKSLEDMAYHLRFLDASCESGSPEIFTHYLLWLKDLLTRVGVPVADLKQSVICVNKVVKRDAPELLTKEFQTAVELGLAALESTQPPFHSFLKNNQPYVDITRKYLDYLLDGKRHEACDLILSEVENGLEIKELYIHVFQTAQYEVGYLWHQGKITVAQEHFCTAACQYIIARLYPILFQSVARGPKVVAACIGDELHEMGIRMVADFFELSGYDTIYLGANMPKEGMLQVIKQNQPVALALSTTIAFHMNELISLINAIREDEACRNVKILVGGYAFNLDSQLWKRVGADGYAKDAVGAVNLLDQLTKK